MKRSGLAVAVVVGMGLLTAAAYGAAKAPTRQPMKIGGMTLLSDAFEGLPSGPWTWSRNVTVTSKGMELDCNTLKAWPSKDGRTFARAEATGNVRIRGTYTADDGALWAVVGSSQSATYTAAEAQAVLTGKVDFTATNQVTKAVYAVKAGKAIYHTKTAKFEFPPTGERVQVTWQQPEQPEAPATPKAAPIAASVEQGAEKQ